MHRPKVMVLCEQKSHDRSNDACKVCERCRTLQLMYEFVKVELVETNRDSRYGVYDRDGLCEHGACYHVMLLLLRCRNSILHYTSYLLEYRLE